MTKTTYLLIELGDVIGRLGRELLDEGVGLDVLGGHGYLRICGAQKGKNG